MNGGSDKSYLSSYDCLESYDTFNKNLAVISFADNIAFHYARKMLDKGLSVYLFGTNISLAEEVQLKNLALSKHLLVLGPGCDCQIISGVSIGRIDPMPQGKIGIISVTGTVLQELCSILEHLGQGVFNAIGAGERDLSVNVGGITTFAVLDALEKSTDSQVIIVAVKSISGIVRNKLAKRLSTFSKPVVTVFLGENPEIHSSNFYHAYTLEEAAYIAAHLAEKTPISTRSFLAPSLVRFSCSEHRTIRANYASSTLAKETAMIIRDTLHLPTSICKNRNYFLNHNGHSVRSWSTTKLMGVRAHPKVEFSQRLSGIFQDSQDTRTGVILLDLYVGHSLPSNPAQQCLSVFRQIQQYYLSMSKRLFIIVHLCGIQSCENWLPTLHKLKENQIFVCDTNQKAVELALYCVGYTPIQSQKSVVTVQQSVFSFSPKKEVVNLLKEKPNILYLGTFR